MTCLMTLVNLLAKCPVFRTIPVDLNIIKLICILRHHLSISLTDICRAVCRANSTVDFPTGDHVNVLNGYTKI